MHKLQNKLTLVLTNCHRSSQNTNVFETGLSDLHKMIASILKPHFSKQKPILLLTATIKGSVMTRLEINLIINCYILTYIT